MKNLKYSNPIPPKAYRCGKCKVTGVKLWRYYLWTDFLCAKCAAKLINIPVTDINADGELKMEHGQMTNAIGFYVPAVPYEECIEDYCWASPPDAGEKWWKALPTTK
jgi:hypothetical protein